MKLNKKHHFSKKQIEAYAAAFRDGDAVKADDKWHEVTVDDEYAPLQSPGHQVNSPEKNNGFRLNYFNDKFKGVADGFKTTKHPYVITTPKDYEVQEGDKLVWLGETQKQGEQHLLTFGKVYDVERGSKSRQLVYKNDMYISILAKSEKDRWKLWGVIPKWENVGEENEAMSNKPKFSVENSGEDVELVEAIDHTGKFKRGDRVRVVSAIWPAHVENIGKEGKIKDIRAGLYRYTVQFDDGDVTLRNFNEVQLELIDEEFKFNIGDEVRIVEDDSLLPYERKYIGYKAKVVKIDRDDNGRLSGCYPYAIDIPGADEHLWFGETALELVSEDDLRHAAEHQALDYLLNQGVGMKEELTKEVIEWAKYYLEELDFKEVKKAIDIAERLMSE